MNYRRTIDFYYEYTLLVELLNEQTINLFITDSNLLNGDHFVTLTFFFVYFNKFHNDYYMIYNSIGYSQTSKLFIIN